MLYKNDATSYNCPQCAAPLSFHFKYSKLIKCASCNSSIFLEDEHVTLVGESSVLSPTPSLMVLNKQFKFQGKTFTPLGKIRYSYGRGFWEEWFLTDESNKEFWLSIDEGDFVLQEKAKVPLSFNTNSKFTVGEKYGQYIVTEKGKGRCVGFEGELPQKVELGEVHIYVHLSKGGGNLVTYEFTTNLTETFKGTWIDPLEIEVLH